MSSILRRRWQTGFRKSVRLRGWRSVKGTNGVERVELGVLGGSSGVLIIASFRQSMARSVVCAGPSQHLQELQELQDDDAAAAAAMES